MAAVTPLAGVRERFPGLRDGWARLDGPAGTQMVDAAIDAIPAADGYKDDVRRVVVALLDRLGVDSPLARDARRRLAAALY